MERAEFQWAHSADYACKECTKVPHDRLIESGGSDGKKFIDLDGSDLGHRTILRHVPCGTVTCMNPTIETLAALQELTNRASKPATPEQHAAISQLRSKVPVPVLVYFDRKVARGTTAVAQVHNGVCMSCHLRIPVGTVASLVSSPNMVTCENCGSYLMLSPDEGAIVSEASGSSKVTVRRMMKRKTLPKATAPAANAARGITVAALPMLVPA